VESHEVGSLWFRKSSWFRPSGNRRACRHLVSRAYLPLEVYPISAGIRGGFAGGVVMVGLAAMYGILSGNGIWYPMNLLVVGLFSWARAYGHTNRDLQSSSAYRCRTASTHDFVLVGMLYGAIAAHGFAAADFCSAVFVAPLPMVLSHVRDAGGDQPGDEPAHRLALVRPLPNGMRLVA